MITDKIAVLLRPHCTDRITDLQHGANLPSILLAVGDEVLAAVLRRHLDVDGHVVADVRRPLAVLGKARSMAWDLVVIDDSELGRDMLVVLPGIEVQTPVIGVGFEDLRLSRSLELPVDPQSLTRAVEALTGRSAEALVLRRERRVAQANGREVTLTRSEFRLLETLLSTRPREVSVAQAMEAVWGASSGSGTPAPLRSHVRNLRLKLSQIGLPDAVRSRRGRGYVLAV